MSKEQIDRLLTTSRPPRGFLRSGNAVLLGLSLLMGGSLAAPDFFGGATWSWVVTQVILIVVVAMVLRSSWRQRRVGQRMLEAFEAVQFQDWPHAREVLFDLLSRPLRPSSARVEAFLALAATCEADHNFVTSQHIYEAILTSPMIDPVQQHTARVALAAAMLRNGQLTDAVNLIDRLERQSLPEPMEAQISLLSLFRETVMGHAHETLERAGHRRQLFRNNLGTRAGFGYALLAAAYDRNNQSDLATHYWHDATLLVEPGRLIERFAEISHMPNKYPAAARPI